MAQHPHDYKDDPDTPVNIQKQVKKAAIGWIVPATLGLCCIAFIALGRLQVQGMLTDYQTKDSAALETENRKFHDAALQDQITEYAKQVGELRAEIGSLRTDIGEVNRQVEHITTAVDDMRDYGHRGTPKQQDYNPK